MSLAFDHTRDHLISEKEAASLVQNFRMKSRADDHHASAFNRSAFEKLLAQPGAQGIRIYRAQHADGSPTMVMVAVDAAGEDIQGPSAMYMQNTTDCPPFCAKTGFTKG